MKDKFDKISIQAIIAMIVITASFGLLYVLFFFHIPNENKDLFNIMGGTMCGSTVTAVIGWLYTQSKKDKPDA